MTTIKYEPSVEVVSSPDRLAQRSTEIFVADANKAIEARGTFYVAISGGHTPEPFFHLLGTMPKIKALLWNKIHLFWVDERYVSHHSSQSNYKLAADTFLNKVPIPQDNIHQIPTEYDDFNMAAHSYEQSIRDVFGLSVDEIPVFDLIVLGMGPDGHTGSLFPGSYASFDTDDLAAVVYVMDEKLNRITLTHPVLSTASHLVVLVSGREKAKIFKEVIASEPDQVKYPIHVLWPVLDKVTWIVDAQAAALL